MFASGVALFPCGCIHGHAQEGYGYLLKMKLWTLTEEKVQQLMRQVELRKALVFHRFPSVAGRF